MTTPTSTAGLLAFRLSPDKFKAYVAESSKPCMGYHAQYDAEMDSSKLQPVVVRGFDADAVAIIKAANDDKGSTLNTTYGLGLKMHTVIRNVEDILRVPSEFWVHASFKLLERTLLILSSASYAQGSLCGVHDSLTSPVFDAQPQRKPLKLRLISYSAVPLYLAQHEYMCDWKRLQPAPPPPGSAPDAQAQATWHLLSPTPDNYWTRYITQRGDAEWNFAMMSEDESLSFTIPPFLDKIKNGVETILKRTELSPDEQPVVADGILLQALEAQDDGSDGVYLNDVTALTRVFSPTRPTMLHVFLHYPSPCNIRILYRLHDLAPASVDANFRIRARDTHPQHGVSGWRLLFKMDISSAPKRTRRGTKDVERRTWELAGADALRMHDALFGPADSGSVGKKVSVLDTVLLVLAAVGFHVHLKQGGTGEQARWDEDRLAYWEGPNWKLDKLDWIAGNLRKACGAPLEGDKLSMEEVVEEW